MESSLNSSFQNESSNENRRSITDTQQSSKLNSELLPKEDTKFGDPLIIANDFESNYIYYKYLTGSSQYRDPIEYLKVYLRENKLKITYISIVNILSALMVYLSFLDTNEKEKTVGFSKSNVFHLICVFLWSYVVLIGCYSTWKVRKYANSALFYLNSEAENTDLNFISTCCKIISRNNYATLFAMLIVLLNQVYKALVVFGIHSSEIGQISQLDNGKTHHKKANSQSNLPSQENSRVSILWVMIFNIGYIMMMVGLRNQFLMRPSVKLALRDINESEARLENIDKLEKFNAAQMDTTMEGTFNLGNIMNMDEVFQDSSLDH